MSRGAKARKTAPVHAPLGSGRIVFVEAGSRGTEAGGPDELAILETGDSDPLCVSLAGAGEPVAPAAGPRDARSRGREGLDEVLARTRLSLLVTRDPAAVHAVLGDEIALLDLAGLARLASPESAGLPRDPAHASAVEKVELTCSLWGELWGKLSSLPTAALAEIGWLLTPSGRAADGEGMDASQARTAEEPHRGSSDGRPGLRRGVHLSGLHRGREVLAEVVRRAELASRSRPGADARSFRDLFADRGEAARQARRERRLGRPDPLDESEVDSLLGPGGPSARAIENYEDRPQQREMARAVARAFSSGRHLFVEGGTGVGKSLAYLVPAALWARRNARPVVVSTYTKNLQSQLFTKDLPLVRRALGGELSVALVKGRRNYLCLRKFFHLLRTSAQELDAAERETLAAVVSWAVRTRTGDLDENATLERSGQSSLYDRLASESEECASRACASFGRCFLQATRASALEADVVVANHALVLAELGIDSPVLPHYQEIVFDEAHHVEDVATEHLAVRVARGTVMRVLARLFRSPRRGQETLAGTGILARVFAAIGRAEGGIASAVQEVTSAAALEVRKVADVADAFFSAAAALVGSERASPERKRRYFAKGREGSAWRRILEAGATLEKDLAEFASRLKDVVETLSRPEAKDLEDRRELLLDLKAQIGLLEQISKDVAFVLAADAELYVYWIEEDAGRSRAGGFAAFCAAPVQVGPLLREQLLGKKRTVIFTSATLRANGSFEYLAGRLGLELGPGPGRDGIPCADTLAVDSPFDYERASLVLVPAYLGDPRGAERKYVEGLARLLVEVFTASRGRGMALFTSYSMLEAARELASGELAARGLRVLAQGRDGPREAMLEELRAGRAGVLLGTSSFWEGIDVPGEALSALVLARLPFHVPSEPVVQARAEAIRKAGRDPFLEYDLPAAVLRLRQGFGRLIRTRSDRGVVVIADPRVLRANYGRAFLDGLPVRARAVGSERALAEQVEKFFQTG